MIQYGIIKKADPVFKKTLIRLFINEIIVTFDKDSNLLNFIIHWKGGTHTSLAVKKRKMPKGNKTSMSLITTVKLIAKRIDDAEIARVLNMNNLTTPRGLRWNKDKVSKFRNNHRIKLQAQKKENFFTAQQAKKYLNVSRNALDTLVKAGIISTNQIMSFAPWELPKEQLDSDAVKKALKNLKQTGFLFPKGYSTKQTSLPFNRKLNQKTV